MRVINAQKELFDVVEMNGVEGLFTPQKVDQDSVPGGVYLYHLRGKSDQSRPVSVEAYVLFCYFGTIFLKAPLDLGDKGYCRIEKNDFTYTGKQMRLYDFFEKGEMKNG